MNEDLRKYALAIAAQEGVDPALVDAIGHAESGWKHDAVSPKGALGPMQLMPATAKGLGVDPSDPYANIRGGVRYLKQLQAQFNDPSLVAAAYNAGPGAVAKAGGVPNFPETRSYVDKVTKDLPVDEARLMAPEQAVDEKRLVAGDVSKTADSLKAAAYALPKAATSLAGFAGDVRDLAKAGREKLLDKLPDWVRHADQFTAPLDNVNPLMAAGQFMPTSGQLRGAAEQVTGPWYDPQTRAGKITDTAIQTGAMMGRNWLTTPFRAAGLAGAMTAGTEGAGAATNDNPWARFLGGAVGGLPVMVANAARSRPGQVVADAIGPMSQQDITQALARQDAAMQQGVPLMGTEAMDRGHGLASYVRSQPRGAAVVDPFLNERPGQVNTAVNRDLISTTGQRATPPVNAARAQQAATNAIKAAEAEVSAQSGPLYRAASADRVPEDQIAEIVARARGMASADQTGIVAPAANEFASRLTLPPPTGKVALPGDETPSIYRTIDKAIQQEPVAPAFSILRPLEDAASTLYPHGYGANQPARFTPLPTRAPPQYITDIENLDRARKYFRDKVDLPAFAADAIPKEASGKVTALNVALQQTMENASPTFANARATHEALSNANVQPMLSGPVGVVAGKGYDASAIPPAERVMSAVGNDKIARPETIRALYEHLNPQDRQAFPGIVQTHLENTLNTALEKPVGGEAITAGAKFDKALRGSPVQAQNFDEMMRGVAQAHGLPADQIVKGANNLLDTLRLTGRTPAVGSATQPRQEIANELRRTKVGDAAGVVSSHPLNWATSRLDAWALRNRTEDLARALTAPDSVQQLLRMAKVQPNGVTAKYYAAFLLGLDKAISAGAPERQ